jgi:hypothetical protein
VIGPFTQIAHQRDGGGVGKPTMGRESEMDKRIFFYIILHQIYSPIKINLFHEIFSPIKKIIFIRKDKFHEHADGVVQAL